jgi:aspartyl aminopeptidase
MTLVTAVDISVARRLCSHIDASPSPYHAVARATELIEGAGGKLIDERDAWPTVPGLWAVSLGGALVAWRVTGDHGPHTGFRVIGAHTDSPNLRVKPNADRWGSGFNQLGVDVYGGALLNSWLDRDLGLAGRVSIRTADGVRQPLIRIDRPLLRIPQLAIHLDRSITETGLLLDRQLHMSPVWGVGPLAVGRFREVLAEDHDFDPSDVLSWDIMLHDLAPSTLAGIDDAFISAPRIDNLASCFLAIEALVDTPTPGPRIPVVCLFDHEEVGSVSAQGAGSPLLGRVLQRISTGLGSAADDLHRALADSIVLSADGAHATHPNYPDRHEPDHRIELNRGPVLKINSNLRYATDSATAACFIEVCEAAGVPYQTFVNRSDLACGSTIGPLTAAQLGVPVVDAGCPQLAMHSARELAGSHDPAWFGAAMSTFLTA